MGVLALDIETASPYGEPEDFQNTEMFEPVCIGLAYWDQPDTDPDTTVLYRGGAFEADHTAVLLAQLTAWTKPRDIEVTLTYNGEYFDAHHLNNWARECVDAGKIAPECASTISQLFGETHIDLMHIVEENYGQKRKFEQMCGELEIDAPRTHYANYELTDDLIVEKPTVEGWHIGVRLGEQYAEWVALPEDQRPVELAELHRLLDDYTRADIEPMLTLALELNAFEVNTDAT
jgi:DNA polymerase elongation subunit (family B)